MAKGKAVHTCYVSLSLLAALSFMAVPFSLPALFSSTALLLYPPSSPSLFPFLFSETSETRSLTLPLSSSSHFPLLSLSRSSGSASVTSKTHAPGPLRLFCSLQSFADIRDRFFLLPSPTKSSPPPSPLPLPLTPPMPLRPNTFGPNLSRTVRQKFCSWSLSLLNAAVENPGLESATAHTTSLGALAHLVRCSCPTLCMHCPTVNRLNIGQRLPQCRHRTAAAGIRGVNSTNRCVGGALGKRLSQLARVVGTMSTLRSTFRAKGERRGRKSQVRRASTRGL
mmetsp:Transcript_29332/g.86920  ORF Transcript_29332/g.86920 Transcript_29332/m.86920 type:complete len:281 (-) Transcript_29332:3183-4025(-)